MNEVTKKPKASQDLIEIATYLYVANPFTEVSEGLRRWPVPDFRNYLIFYCPTETGVSIIRVLHGSRDITAALQEEDDGFI